MRPVSAALLACALIPTSISVAACQPRTVTDTSRRIYCEVMPDAPERDNADAPTRIIGTVRFRCDEPGAASMALTMQLQRRNAGGAWLDVVGSSFAVSGRQTVGTRDETFRTRKVSTGCGDGTYRVFVKGTSTARGVTKTYERAGPRSFTPCHPGIFSRKK